MTAELSGETAPSGGSPSMIAWLRPVFVTNACLYAITVALALHYSWQADDLVWGVWITGIMNTLGTVVVPVLALMLFPKLDPTHAEHPRPGNPGAHVRSTLFMLAVYWGSLIFCYFFACLWILDWIPLPEGVPEIKGFTTIPLTFVVCLREYWLMIVVNLVGCVWQSWAAIRAQKEMALGPFIAVGRVMVVCTVMGVLYLFHINSVAVVILLFLLYIPEDVFGRRVLGLE